MQAIIYKLITDAEGESKITFCVPLTEIAEVVKLNLLLGKELELTIKAKSTESKGK